MHGARLQRMVMHVRSVPNYPNSWARLVSELIERPGWTQQRLADAANVDRGTIRRWRIGESVNVSSDSIRLIADAAGIDHDIAARAAVGAQDAAHDDEAIRDVMAEDLSPEDKQELIDLIRTRRAEAEAALRRDIDFILRTRREAS